MSINQRYKYLKVMKPRYKQGNRGRRSELLDEMECVTGMHRQSLIRLMNGSLTREPRRRQFGRYYMADVPMQSE